MPFAVPEIGENGASQIDAAGFNTLLRFLKILFWGGISKLEAKMLCKFYIQNENDKLCAIETNRMTTFNDISLYLGRALGLSQNDIQSNTCFLHIGLKDNWVEPIMNYSVEEFIKANNLNNERVEIQCEFGGIGAGMALEGPIKIQIRANEPEHRNTPHIHVSNDKGQNYVSISIDNLEVIEGQKLWEQYHAKERKLIKTMINNSKKELIDFYNSQLNGIVPKPVKIKYKGKACFLGYNRSLGDEQYFME